MSPIIVYVAMPLVNGDNSLKNTVSTVAVLSLLRTVKFQHFNIFPAKICVKAVSEIELHFFIHRVFVEKQFSSISSLIVTVHIKKCFFSNCPSNDQANFICSFLKKSTPMACIRFTNVHEFTLLLTGNKSSTSIYSLLTITGMDGYVYLKVSVG